jgi:putative restriction endonuclease
MDSSDTTKIITLAGGRFEILDLINNVTIPDCIVFNKIGSGHGEKKMYVGSITADGNRPTEFFDDFTRDCFFLKKDLVRFMQDIYPEFQEPQQNYAKPFKLMENYQVAKDALDEIHGEYLTFKLYQVGVKPPRIYVNSNSDNWNIFRRLAVKNISYISFMKLKSVASGKIFYYCRPFVDYRTDLIAYESPIVQSESNRIANSNMSDSQKKNLSEARQGQGEYRRKLIEDCQFCPFTLVNDERLLIASHIKPWVDSTDSEKIDPKNGFALTPTYDRLFDQGYITFEPDKIVRVSPWISPMNQHRLSIYDGMKLPKLQLDDKREYYLQYHREKIYKG